VTNAARKVFDQALALQEDERLKLAEALFDSLPTEVQERIDEGWREEILRRVEETRKGEIELESWDAVRGAGREALTR
jgi:putative addiction module component (TIGR02574 family)